VVKLTSKEWADIYNRLAKDWPSSHLLIREVMRRELGFTVRRHQEWVNLDFYDDAKETWFRLRYLDRE